MPMLDCYLATDPGARPGESFRRLSGYPGLEAAVRVLAAQIDAVAAPADMLKLHA